MRRRLFHAPAYLGPAAGGLGASLLLLTVTASATAVLPLETRVPAPSAVHLDGQAVTFYADGRSYRSPDAGETWEAVANSDIVAVRPFFQGRRVYVDTSGVQTIFQSELGRDAARLLIRVFDGLRVEPLAQIDLYDRWQVREAIGRARGRKFLITPSDTLPSAPEPAPALFSEIRRAGNSLWFSVAWEAGPRRGVSALVRHELDTRETRVYRPIALENLALARLALTPDAVWIAAGDTVAGKFGTRVLVRFDPLTEDAHVVPSVLDGGLDEIRALETASDTVWLATRTALHRMTEVGDSWVRWRLLSTVRVDRREEISTVPGQLSRRAVPSGTYRVLAMTADSLLVETSDFVEGWVPPDTLAETPVRLRDAPKFTGTVLGVFPPGEAIVPLPLRTADGWTKARARAGWLLRSDRVPRPVVGPAEPLRVAETASTD